MLHVSSWFHYTYTLNINGAVGHLDLKTGRKENRSDNFFIKTRGTENQLIISFLSDHTVPSIQYTASQETNNCSNIIDFKQSIISKTNRKMKFQMERRYLYLEER